MRSAVFGAVNIAVVLVDGSNVGTTALGACDEGFGTFTVGAGVAEAEAASTLKEGRTVLKGANGGFAAKEIRG
jgi:hypothetical protein